MIKRAVSDVQLISKRFPNEKKEFLNDIKSIQPSDEDLIGAVDGLLRLQVVFKLKTEDFANGIIYGKKTREALTVHDLFVMGVEASKMKDKEFLALEYLNLAHDQVNQGYDFDDEIDKTVLLSHIVSCYYRTGDYSNSQSILQD